MIDSARSFISIAELGSFARAAEKLDLSTAAVSRHLSYLEETLGARLLQRTTRQVHLTETGQLCYDRFRRILTEIEDLGQQVQLGLSVPQGVLKISSTTMYWMHRIAPRLPEFMKRYPKLGVQVSLTERSVDLISDGYDLALQINRPTSHSVVTRSLVPLTRIIYASPAYLAEHGTPRDYAELARHNCLLYAHSSEQVEWQFLDADEMEVSVPVAGTLRSSDANTLRLAALAGIGICRSPLFLLQEDLRQGRVVQILSQFRSIDTELWAVYPSRKQLAPKVRAFIDFLDEVRAADPLSSVDSPAAKSVDQLS